MTYRTLFGYSIIELILVILMISILAFASVLPFRWYHQKQVDLAVDQTKDMVRIAQRFAFARKQGVTLCSVSNDDQCRLNEPAYWAIKDATHQIIYREAIASNANIQSTWVSWPISSNGMLARWGTITICSDTLGTKLILIASGRVRTEPVTCK